MIIKRYRKVDNLKYEFFGVQNNCTFKHKGHYFTLPNFEGGECPVFCNKFCVHNGKITKDKKKVILGKNFMIFVDCVHVSHKDQFIICIQNGVIGSRLIITRLIWLLDRIMEFFKKYLGINFFRKVVIRLFFGLPNRFENQILLVDLNTFPFPEKDPHNFKKKLRVLTKRIFVAIYNKKRDEALVSLLCIYFERFTFNNQNELLYAIHKDYKANRNNRMYHYFRILNEEVKSNKPLLSPFYLKALTRLLLIDNPLYGLQNKKFPRVMYEYPILEIDVEEVSHDYIFYLKISVNQKNGSWFRGHIECLIYERTGKKEINLFVDKIPTTFHYNCRGRVNKNRKDLKKRKTKAPEKIFKHVEFNYNGKLPCFLITTHVNQNMLNCCGFWTKLVCLDNLKELPNYSVIKDVVNDVLFCKSKKDGYFKLLKPLCRFLFNKTNFMKFIPNINHYNPKNINFAIGLYKRFYLEKNIYCQIKIKDLYNPVQYTLRKMLIKQINLCFKAEEQNKLIIFFKQIIEDFGFRDKNFFEHLEKCFVNRPILRDLLLKKNETVRKQQLL